MTSRDELVTLISNIESRLNETLEVSAGYKKIAEDKKENVDQTKKAIDTLRLQMEIEAEEHRKALYDYTISTTQLKKLKTDLDIARRQLDRLFDAEQIQQQLAEQLDKFKSSCLDAVWRSENRSDGRGAFEYQIEGAIQMAIAKQGLLGDKRGLGKTLTSLIWCDLIEAKRVIMICPSDTMDNFIREIAMWTPHRQPLKLGKMTRAQRDFILTSMKHLDQYMIVLNFEAWRHDPQLVEDLIALGADTLIVDEAHQIKDTTTSAFKGVKSIRFGMNSCKCGVPALTKDGDTYKCWCGEASEDVTNFCSVENVLLMTGTPILNKPQELFALVSLIDPKNFKSLKNFTSDFCYQIAPNKWTWHFQAEQRVIKTIGPRLLVRDRASAGIMMAPPEPIIHSLTLDEMKEFYPLQYEAYVQARDYAQIILDPDNGIVERMIKITALLRMRQILSWPGDIEPKAIDLETMQTYSLGKLNIFESIKLDKAEAIIREINEEGDRAVLFSQFKDPLVALQRRLGDRTAVYAGGTSSYLRNEIVLDFDAKTAPDNPRWDNVLCNYRSGGVGLNLNAANHLIMLDKEWNYGKEDQAIGRVDRLGQLKNTFVHDLQVLPSVDSWMSDLIKTKSELVEGFEGEADLFRQAYDAIKNGKI